MRYNAQWLLITFYWFPFLIQAQEYQSDVITLCKTTWHEGFFHVYDPPFRARRTYAKLDEVENKYPEQVYQSMMSATSQEWVDYNTYGGSEKSRKQAANFFTKNATQDKEKNYYELVAKFQYNTGDMAYAVIKAYLHLEGDENLYPSALVLIREGERWYTNSAKEEAMMVYFFSNFSLSTIQAVIEGRETDDPFIKTCQGTMRREGFFDFNQAPKLLGNLKVSGDITAIQAHLEWVHWPR